MKQDKMAPNTVKDSYKGVSGKNNYAVSGMHVNPIGEKASTAKITSAPARGSALEQMSDGSMNYLKHEDSKYASDVKKLKRTGYNY